MTTNPGALEPLLAALRRISPMPPDDRLTQPLLRAYRDMVGKVLALDPPDPRAIPGLLGSFGPGEGGGEFLRVVRHISTLPPADACPALVAALEKGPVGARRWAAVALGDFLWLDAVPALEAALEDPEIVVRQAANDALRKISASTASEDADDEDGPDPLFEGLTEIG